MRKTSANTFSFGRLHPHTLYQFRVNATYNRQNCAKQRLSLSPAVRVRTEAVAPNPPKNINVMALGSKSLEIGWNSVKYRYGTVSYLVYYNITQLKYEAKAAKSSSVLLTGLTPYTKYEVKVAVVVRPWGANDGSEDVTSTTNRTKLIATLHAKPSVPLDVTFDNNTLTAVSAKIFWTVPVNGPVLYYNVSYVMGLHSNANVSAITVRTVEKSNHITLKNLIPFTFYTVSVQAINIDRGHRLVSSASAVRTFRTLADAPSKPQNLKISDLQAKAARFIWEAPAQPNGPIAYYIITLAMGRVDPQNYSSQKIVLREKVSGQTSYAVNGLTQISQYSVWIIAVNIEVSKELKSSPSQVQIFNTTSGATIHTTIVYTTKTGTTTAVTDARSSPPTTSPLTTSPLTNIPPPTSATTASSPVSITGLPITYIPRGSGLPTRSCEDEKTNLKLTPAVATLAVFSIILLVLAAYFLYQWRHVIAVGGAKESNAIKMDEREERRDAVTYETVVDSGRQPDVLTRSPLYEETSVIDNPSYGVVTDQN